MTEDFFIMIYLDKLNTKLQAILDKNLQEIVDKNTYIPFLGVPNNTSSLQNWLNKRIQWLENARDLPESEVIAMKDDYYNSLSSADKLVADQILAGEEYEFADEEQWENLVPIILYYFVTNP